MWPLYKRSSASFLVDGGRTWWAHFEFTRINIEPIILRKKIEDLREARASIREASDEQEVAQELRKEAGRDQEHPNRKPEDPESHGRRVPRSVASGRRTLSGSLVPETPVDYQRLILQRRSMHFNWALAVGKHVPAPYPQPVTIGIQELIEGAFTQCEHHPSDAAPEYGAAAHGAGLGTRIQAAASQEVRSELAGRQPHQVCDGVARAIWPGHHCVFRFDQHLTIGASEQGAKRLVAMFARALGERDGGPEMLEIRIGHVSTISSRQPHTCSAKLEMSEDTKSWLLPRWTPKSGN